MESFEIATDAIRIAHPYPVLFATLAGAHLYGFPSKDSDFDIRGAHILPIQDMIGLFDPRETVHSREARDGKDIDMMTHDVRKFSSLLLQQNPFALEQTYSPKLLLATPEFEELKIIARGCITRRHGVRYLQMVRDYRILMNLGSPEIRHLLHTYRSLLTGIHLMKTGRMETDLTHLNANHDLLWIDEAIAFLRQDSPDPRFARPKMEAHDRELERLSSDLVEAHENSQLPGAPISSREIHEWLIRLRLGSNGSATAAK